MRADEGRLGARPSPGPPRGDPLPEGSSPLALGAGRDGVVHRPEGVAPDVPAPLVIALHGAGGDAAGGLAPLLPLADEFGVVLVAPASLGSTWDVILGGFGPDVTALDRALADVFARQAVDPARVAVAGFSDGASYALSLGLTNGDLFPAVIAFSPGFAAPGPRAGKPAVFITHGIDDRVLPIDRCSRVLVPRLQRDGHDVRYTEFPGGHEVPPPLARASLEFLTAP